MGEFSAQHFSDFGRFADAQQLSSRKIDGEADKAQAAASQQHDPKFHPQKKLRQKGTDQQSRSDSDRTPHGHPQSGSEHAANAIEAIRPGHGFATESSILQPAQQQNIHKDRASASLPNQNPVKSRCFCGDPYAEPKHNQSA
jgi:hypothetical protein